MKKKRQKIITKRRREESEIYKNNEQGNEIRMEKEKK